MADRRLKATWYAGWHHDVGAALALLPEMATCPHKLLELLLREPTRAEKRAAVVTADGTPVAVFGLAKRDRHWQPVGEIPDAVGAGRTEDLVPAMSALGAYVRIWGWRHSIPDRGLMHVERIPDYFTSTETDWDTTWRELHNTPHINRSRNRCERLGNISLEIDSDEGVRWTIEQWAAKWRPHYSDMDSMVTDLSTTASYLKSRGQYHSFRLLHGDRPVAGSNWFVAGDRLVLHTTVFDPEYAKYGVGVRMTELALRWSSSSPYRYVGLGAGGSYKERWLRPQGEAANFSVMPRPLAVVYQGRDLARSIVRGLRRNGGSQSAGGDDALA
jgi:hypothetical protein